MAEVLTKYKYCVADPSSNMAASGGICLTYDPRDNTYK